jgi:lipopolysaccharide/colanic/teichoic acid biosynthesis glycosyltransferase
MLLVNAAFLLSFLIRYGANIPHTNFAPYKDNFAFLTFIYISSLAFAKVYKNRFKSVWEIFKRIVVGLFIGTLLSLTFIYIFRIQWSSFPSSIFAISFPLGVFFIFTVNSLVLRSTGKIKKIILVIGHEDFNDVLENNRYIEKRYVNRIEELINYWDIDEIRICEILQDTAQLNLIMYLMGNLKINVMFSPSIYLKLVENSLNGDNSVLFFETFLGSKSDSEEFLIRALDILGSLVMLIVLSPLIGLAALGIKLTSSGSVFYKQKRIGKDGKLFTLYKFRTMIENTEQHNGPVITAKNDSRVTKIGRFLRNTRMDEIPQLINVIRGEMSLVGPRPEVQIRAKSHKALRGIRLAVKPGLTGLAQIRREYDLHPKHKIKYDYLYIQRRSLALNLYILYKTIPVVLSGRGQ